MPPAPFFPRLRRPRPEEPPRHSGDWMEESSGQDTSTPKPPSEAAHGLGDCTLDWITLQPSDGCQPSETS